MNRIIIYLSILCGIMVGCNDESSLQENEISTYLENQIGNKVDSLVSNHWKLYESGGINLYQEEIDQLREIVRLYGRYKKTGEKQSLELAAEKLFILGESKPQGPSAFSKSKEIQFLLNVNQTVESVRSMFWNGLLVEIDNNKSIIVVPLSSPESIDSTSYLLGLYQSWNSHPRFSVEEGRFSLMDGHFVKLDVANNKKPRIRITASQLTSQSLLQEEFELDDELTIKKMNDN